MTSPLAGISDVEAAWRPLGDTETAKAGVLLVRASAIVRSKIATVDARLADGTLDDDLVSGIVGDMVARVLRNPEAVRQKSVGSVSVAYDTVPGQGLYLTDEELSLLRTSSTRKGPVGTADLRRAL